MPGLEAYTLWFACLQVAAAGSMATVGSINVEWWRHARSERALVSTALCCWSVALTLLVGAVGLSFPNIEVAAWVVPIRAVLIGVTAALFITTLGTLLPLPAVRTAAVVSVLLPVIHSIVGLTWHGSYSFVDGSPWPRTEPVGSALVGLSTMIFLFYAVKGSIGLSGTRRRELAAATITVVALLVVPLLVGPGVLTEAVTSLWTLPIAILLGRWCSARALTLQGSLESAQAGWRQAEHTAWYQARHDKVTGLPNRDAAVDALSALLRGAFPVVVTELHVGRLAELQAAAEPSSSDLVMQAIAGHLVSVLPLNAELARVSEHSFVTMSPLSEEARGADLAELASQAVAVLRRAASVPDDLALSVGIAVSFGGGTAVQLLQDVGTAVIAAEQVPSRVQLYRPELKQEIVQRARLARLLTVAVDRGEFELHYQPVLDTFSLARVGVEALVRWRHHGRLHPPAFWIPIAEQKGLMPAIGLHVLRLAAHDQPALGCPIAVNVSACQLADANFTDDVLRALRDVDHRSVILEVTESVVMADLERAHTALAVLQSHGIRIALDDFGTEYSSLSRLATMPFDILKIDRSFIANVHTHDGRAIVTAIQALARSLDKTTVAEGIETREQLAAITEIGCDHIQGYFTGHPVPLAELRRPTAPNYVPHSSVLQPGRPPGSEA